MKVHSWIFLSLLWSLTGCRESGLLDPEPRPPGSGTYVVNEGGFGGGGTLSFFDPATSAVTHDVVRNAVDWLFPNDILLDGGKMYVAVNGTDRICVLDPLSDSVISVIVFPPGAGPGFLSAGEGGIYTANYDGSVSLIDPAADTLVRTSSRVTGFPGDILVAGGRVLLSDVGAWPDTGEFVRALDPLTLALLDSVRIGGSPSGMALAAGDLFVGTLVPGAIWRLDPGTLRLKDSCLAGAIPGDIASDGAQLFVLTGDAVLRVPVDTFAPDSVPLAARSGGLYHYAMAYDPAAGEIYVSTVVSAGGSGSVAVLTRTGLQIGTSFAVGIFPGAFGFYRPDAE